MPRYGTHIIFNFLVLAVVFLLVQYLKITIPFTMLAGFLLGFLVASFIITPDIDTKSEAARKCGVLCAPYRVFFRHRKTSHSILVGTATRIIYLLCITLITMLILIILLQTPSQYIIQTFMIWLRQYWRELLMLASGMFLADASHIILDKVS